MKKLISSALLLLAIIVVGACGTQKVASKAQKLAKIKAKEWSKEGYKVMGAGVAEMMLEEFYLAEMMKDAETGFPVYLTTEVIGIESSNLDVALQEAIFSATTRMADQIRSKVQAKQTRDVNNADGQAYTKYLGTATSRTAAKISGGQVVYKVYKETRKGFAVTLGYAYSFEKATEMFRQEMLLAMAQESEEYRKQAEAEFLLGLGDF